MADSTNSGYEAFIEAQKKQDENAGAEPPSSGDSSGFSLGRLIDHLGGDVESFIKKNPWAVPFVYLPASLAMKYGPKAFDELKKLGEGTPKHEMHEGKKAKALDRAFAGIERGQLGPEKTPLHDLSASDLKVIQEEAGRDNKTAKRLLKAWNEIQPSPQKQVMDMIQPYVNFEQGLPGLYNQLQAQASSVVPSFAQADTNAQNIASEGLKEVGDTGTSPVNPIEFNPNANTFAGQSPISQGQAISISPQGIAPDAQTEGIANQMQAYINQGTPSTSYMDQMLGQIGGQAQQFQQSVPYSGIIQALEGRELYGMEGVTSTGGVQGLPNAAGMPQWLQSLYQQATGLNPQGGLESALTAATHVTPTPSTQGTTTSYGGT